MFQHLFKNYPKDIKFGKADNMKRYICHVTLALLVLVVFLSII